MCLGVFSPSPLLFVCSTAQGLVTRDPAIATTGPAFIDGYYNQWYYVDTTIATGTASLVPAPMECGKEPNTVGAAYPPGFTNGIGAYSVGPQLGSEGVSGTPQVPTTNFQTVTYNTTPYFFLAPTPSSGNGEPYGTGTGPAAGTGAPTNP